MIVAPDPAEVAAATPCLAQLAQAISLRPFWEMGEPFAIDPGRYEMAYREMAGILKARGWRKPGSAPGIAGENFMLFGTPIVRMQ